MEKYLQMQRNLDRAIKIWPIYGQPELSANFGKVDNQQTETHVRRVLVTDHVILR